MNNNNNYDNDSIYKFKMIKWLLSVAILGAMLKLRYVWLVNALQFIIQLVGTCKPLTLIGWAKRLKVQTNNSNKTNEFHLSECRLALVSSSSIIFLFSLTDFKTISWKYWSTCTNRNYSEAKLTNHFLFPSVVYFIPGFATPDIVPARQKSRQRNGRVYREEFVLGEWRKTRSAMLFGVLPRFAQRTWVENAWTWMSSNGNSKSCKNQIKINL